MKKSEIKLIDCTIRDGGLMNNWDFSLETVTRLFEANKAAGIAVMEMGYRVSPKVFRPEEHGPWKFCPEELLRRVTVNGKGSMKIAVMGDIGRVYKEDFIPRENSLIDIFRLACYVDQIDEALDMCEYLNRLGYEVFINIMAVSSCLPKQIRGCLEKVSRSDAAGIYLSDTFGSFLPHEVSKRLGEYGAYCPGKKLGFHGHNNTQMALANSLAAAETGAEYIDGSYYGMGRGAGNTPLELLLPKLGSPKNLSPMFKVIQTEIEPLMERYKWGYRIPYAVSGILNQHPRKAMALMETDGNECYGAFYEKSAG